MNQDIKVTVDAVIFTEKEGREMVLLVKRKNDPYKGQWALPGGFVEEDEDLPDAAARELEEETGIRAAVLRQVKAFGKPGRDPRGPTVTIAYRGRVEYTEPRAATDAAEANWHPLNDLPELAFDHAEILQTATKI